MFGLRNKLVHYLQIPYFFIWFVKWNRLIHHHLIPHEPIKEWSHSTKFEEWTHDASPHLVWFDCSNQTPYIPSGWPLTPYQTLPLISGVFNRCWWSSYERRVWQAVCCPDTRSSNMLTSLATDNYCSASKFSQLLQNYDLWLFLLASFFFACKAYCLLSSKSYSP